MRITLQDVRHVLRQAFGGECFVATFIRAIESDPSIATACINANGQMRYNPDFAGEHIKGRADLFSLITHELLHPMFGHFIYDTRHELEAVGADMVINATISTVFCDDSENGALFARLYADTGLMGLLRPRSRMQQSRYSSLYDNLYGMRRSKLSTGEVIQALKILTPARDVEAVLLLGSHGGTVNPPKDGLSQETLSRIASDFQEAVRSRASRRSGYGSNLFEFIIEVLKTHIGLKRVLLHRYLTRKKLDHFLAIHHHAGIATSPIPLRPSKRDLVLLAAGIHPLHYHQPVVKYANQNQGLAVYLDVSGSVNEHLPRIAGLLRGLERDLVTIYLFSNRVVEVAFSTVLRGQVQTTYGTDFDCIAESILEKRLDKAIVMTDGYASLSEDNQEALHERHVRLLTILFGGKTDCPEFEPFGDVLQLNDAVE